MNWPISYEKMKWKTEAQQQVIWDFVHNGGRFVPLHNAQGFILLSSSTTGYLVATTEATLNQLSLRFAWRTRIIPSRQVWRTMRFTMSST
jgi:hypothetical protein